jgi:RNA polymerase subunit RPABC4/transcription elongation factor Spt4
MAAPRLERIRPCLHCGALMTFSALRCGSCGTPVAGAPLIDERVRPCLQCGVILRFDQDPCPHCGARARGEVEDRVKPCTHCGAIVPFDQFYCRECGELSIPIRTDPIPPEVDLVDRGRPSERVPAWLGGLAFAAGMATLLVAAVDILR